VAFLDRHPVLKRAVANQYQAILLAGAAGFSLLFANPLPLALLFGAELMAMPLLMDRLKRRMEIEKKYAARTSEAMSLDQRLAELPPQAKERFSRLAGLCKKIEENYRGLSAESQGLLAEQSEKFDAILASCLRRLWLLRKYDEMISLFDGGRVAADVKKLKEALAQPALDGRVREAYEQNLDIKQKLLESGEKNQTNRTALLAELDSLESLLQLLHQKSVAATDARAFALELDDALQQAESDAQSVEEMEKLLGAMPEMIRPTTGERLRDAADQRFAGAVEGAAQSAAKRLRETPRNRS
jgi:hypothetical protein